MKTVENASSSFDLESLLKLHDIPFDSWGTGESKTFGHLLQDINSGEASLLIEDGKVIWSTVSAGVDIRCCTPWGEMVLVEDRQVFTDGRERRRKSLCTASLMEKMKPGESFDEAARRAIGEELGFPDIKILFSGASRVERVGPIPARSYPGLWSTYLMTVFCWQMPWSLFRIEGYVEVQSDKVNYFIWRRVS